MCLSVVDVRQETAENHVVPLHIDEYDMTVCEQVPVKEYIDRRYNFFIKERAVFMH